MSQQAEDRFLNVSSADRGALGLTEDERLRVVDVTADSLYVERIDRDGAHVCAGPPGLKVDVAVLPLAAALNAIHDSGKSGLLRYTWRAHEKSIYLDRGEVVFASSNQRVDRLGECLLRAGVINLDQLRDAERCFTQSERFGKVLVERGFLTPRELWNGVKYQVEEIVRSLFAMPGGSVSFWEGEFQPDNVVRLSLETARLVAEGIQRSEELRKFLAVLEDGRVRLAQVAAFSETLAGSERAIVEAIGAESAFAEICESLDVDRESAARSIQLLRLVGAVKLMRLPEPAGVILEEADLGSADDQALRARVAATVKLLGELRGAVANGDGESPAGVCAIDDRLGRVLEDATSRFPALLTGITLREGRLDPEILAARATKLPGNREAQVVESLGELVSYLEFEIMNHPGIEDSDAVLSELATLRREITHG